MESRAGLAVLDRPALLRRAKLLSWLSVALSGLVGVTAVVIGLVSDRLSLLGFDFDASVDSIASIELLWRFTIETSHPHRAERAEEIAECVVSVVLIVLATYLTIGALQALASGAHPGTSTVAIAISIVSLVILPPLALAKRRVARALESGALRADSTLTGIAAMLALISLLAYVVTENLGIAGADAIGGLVVAAVLVREGLSAFRG
jgi:divalent metal cation (Fe/Co/Zn/Cd) transporter